MDFETETDLHVIDNGTYWTFLNEGNESGVRTTPEPMPIGERDPLSIVVPVTCVYGLIFLTGLVGNVSTCIVIARNRAMHTATNYYLFSLAVSDLLLLVCGMPTEIYHMWWPAFYLFGDTVCFLQGLAAETSANASVLTITAFTVERYIAICHPFLSHTMSKLSRAIKFIVAIWIVATCLAVPQAIQFGVLNTHQGDRLVHSTCTITKEFAQHAFELSTFIVFVGPMCVITALYLLIGVKLRRSRLVNTAAKHRSAGGNDFRECPSTNGCRSSKNYAAQNRVIRMLVAVVVAFFICWAPFHAQRLLAVYIRASIDNDEQPEAILITIYTALTYTSGVLYFLSTTINPLLYHIMSNKFREAFKTTLAQLCKRRKSTRHLCVYSPISINRQPSMRNSSSQPQSFNEPTLNRINSSNRDEYISLQLQNNHRYQSELKKSRQPQFRYVSRPPSNLSCSLSHSTTSTNLSKENRSSLKRYYSDNQMKLFSGKPVSRVVISKKMSKNSTKKMPVRFGTFTNTFRCFTKVSKSSSFDKNDRYKRKSTFSVNSDNTISDSSLQNLDDTEFSSSDLVRYMGEVNHNIISPPSITVFN